MKKSIAFLLVCAFVLTLSACSSGNLSPAATTAAQKTTAEKTPDVTTTAPKVETRPQLTMFMGDAGIKVPTDVDVSDNHIVNIIEDMANVDLVITKPEYMDFQTKFNLMMSSGEVLDIVHAWFPDDIKRYGTDGAFIPLDDIIANSAALSSWRTAAQTDVIRASDGKIYGLFALTEPEGDIGGHVIRYDLVEELNGGVVPVTPEDWYDFAVKVKQAYPESTPFSSQGNLQFMTQFFMAYGVQMQSGGVSMMLDEDNQVIFSFEAPGMKDAVVFYNKLYKAGLIDLNFITNKYEDFVLNRIPEHNVISLDGGHWAIQIVLEEYIKKGNLANQMLSYAPYPIAPGFTAEDVAKTKPKSDAWGHSMSISSTCKEPDAAGRVLEAFIDPETKFVAGYGTEGKEFHYADGKPVPDLAVSTENDWRLIYGFMWHYWYNESIAVKNAGILSKADTAYQERFAQLWNDTVTYNKDRAQLGGMPPFDGMLLSDEVNAKHGDMQADSLQIVLKAIVGQISMDEYDTQVNGFLQKYAFYKQAVQEWYDAK